MDVLKVAGGQEAEETFSLNLLQDNQKGFEL